MSDGGTYLPGGEQGPRRPRGPGGGPPHGVAAHTTRAARGAGLIALAVILGVVLLQLVDKGNTGPIGDRSAATHAVATTTTTAAATSTSATTAPSSSTMVAATRPPGQVVVDVLNGSGVAGVAGQLTTQLKAKGYQTITPGDTAQHSGSVVYYRSGFEREATALATLVPDNPKVAAMPSPAPQNADPSANVVVVIGG